MPVAAGGTVHYLKPQIAGRIAPHVHKLAVPNIRRRGAHALRDLDPLPPRSIYRTGAHNTDRDFQAPLRHSGITSGTGHASKPIISHGSHPAHPAHPADNRPAQVPQTPFVANPGHTTPPGRRLGFPHKPGVGGGVTAVGGFIAQTNPGGTTSGVGGSNVSTTGPLSGYFSNIGSGFGDITLTQAAEVAAIIIAIFLGYRYLTKKKGRR